MRLPHLPSQPPIWREPLMALEVASLMRDPVYRGAGISGGHDQPVMLIPGFLAGDGSLGLMTKWLRRTGHHTCRAGMRSNVDCSEAAIERLTLRLEQFAEKRGGPVSIIGQSRGGTFARVLAVRRPDLVSGIITLGSPLRDILKIHPLVRFHILTVGALGSLGAPGLFKHSCRYGNCCTDFWDDLRAPFPEEVGFLSIYSKRDGIVDWRSCLDPAAEMLEVSASHLGMGVNAQAYRAVAFALRGFREAGTANQQAARRAARVA